MTEGCGWFSDSISKDIGGQVVGERRTEGGAVTSHPGAVRIHGIVAFATVSIGRFRDGRLGSLAECSFHLTPAMSVEKVIELMAQGSSIEINFLIEE